MTNNPSKTTPQMPETDATFTPETWVVHRDHGVGRIVAVEEKAIGGKVSSYYRVETENSVIFAPVSDAERLRPVMAPDEFDEAMAVLHRPARRLQGGYHKRVAHLRQVRQEDSPVAVARLLRDLWARRQQRGQLSNTEERAWRRLSKRFIAEWAASRGMELSAAKERLYALLREEDDTVESATVKS